MKCYVCDHEEKEFPVLSVSGTSCIVSRANGSVKLYACPDCGAVHTDLRRTIKKEDRKGKSL